VHNRETFHLRPDGEKAFGYAQAVRSGNTVRISGSLSVDEEFQPLHPGDMGAQIDTIYAGVRRTLENFGATLVQVVQERIYVTDMDSFLTANSRRVAAYEGAEFPAATVVQISRLAFPECMVEIEVTAEL
jgi:2-iminobutanoate/2-iminopropanoate deaminase